MQESIDLFIQIIKDYGYIIVFWGTILAGDLVILAAVFLASLKYLNIYLVILVSLVGLTLSDIFWYYVGRKFKNRISHFRRRFFKHRFADKIESLKYHFQNHYGKFVFSSKFIYGTRIVTLVAAGHENVPFKKFFYFNFVGSVVWILVISAIGYLMGFSWQKLDDYNSYVRYLVVLGILLIFVFRFFFRKLLNFNGYGSRS